jgi:Bacterial-like globin
MIKVFGLTLGVVALTAAALAGCSDGNTGDTTSSSSASGSGSSSSSSGAGGEGGGGGGGGAGGGPPAACSQEMYAKYGDAGFTAVNNKIIEKTVAITNMSPSPIGDSFKPTIADPAKAAAFTASLAAFLIQAYGGPKNYTGKTMELAHVGMAITSAQYDYFIANAVVPALQEAGVDAKDISDCFAPVVVDPAFKNSIIDK